MWWQEWWVWGIAAMGFAILETLLPGYVFLGFAVGAGALAGALGLGLSGVLPGSAAGLLAVFAALSIVAWLGLRRLVGVRAGQRRVFHRDINED